MLSRGGQITDSSKDYNQTNDCNKLSNRTLLKSVLAQKRILTAEVKWDARYSLKPSIAAYLEGHVVIVFPEVGPGPDWAPNVNVQCLQEWVTVFSIAAHCPPLSHVGVPRQKMLVDNALARAPRVFLLIIWWRIHIAESKASTSTPAESQGMSCLLMSYHYQEMERNHQEMKVIYCFRRTAPAWIIRLTKKPAQLYQRLALVGDRFTHFF